MLRPGHLRQQPLISGRAAGAGGHSPYLNQRLSLGYHRQNRAKEIRSRFHQLVRASCFKLISVTVPPKHTKTAHSNRVSADHVISTVPDHDTARGGYTLFGQDMSEQLWLPVQLTAWH